MTWLDFGWFSSWPWPRFFKVKYGICNISAKNGPIATKRKANISIELQGLKCVHRAWPWPRPRPLIFKVKFGISYISAKSCPIATKRKANISIELQGSNVTNGFDLDHNHDLWILKVKRDLDLWPHTWPWAWIFRVKFRNSCISEWGGGGGGDWHCTKGVAVGHSWPWPWPFGDQGQVYGSTR